MERVINRFVPECIYHNRGISSSGYALPIKPRSGEKPRYWRDSISHIGSDCWAVDYIIPDPRENPLVIIAPASGEVINIELSHSIYGPTQDFAVFNNYVDVQVTKKEFYRIVHIGKLEGKDLEIGDIVNEGEPILVTAANGWMTDVRHTHFMVAFWVNRNKGIYKSLKIRQREYPIPYPLINN